VRVSSVACRISSVELYATRRQHQFSNEAATPWIVDDAVVNPVVGVALGEHRLLQDLQLREALRCAVAVFVESKVAREVVREDALSHPYVRDVQSLVVEHRGTGHDTVEVVGIALRLHESLSPTGGASLEVGERRGAAIERPDNGLRDVRSEMHRAMTEVDYRVEVILCERRARFRGGIVTGIGVRHRIPLGQPVIREIEDTVLAAVTNVEEPAVPVFRQR